MKRSLFELFVALALAWLCSCASQPAPVLAPMRRAPTDAMEGYFVGAAVADITPPLHLSLFGHGPEGRIATGVRLRLRCQVFVLAQGTELFALVPCDLQSPSLSLQREIAEYLRKGGIPITPDRIFLMATHTHAAPGHYFEARHYSGPFSSSAPGHDKNVVAFLTNQIGDAVVRAFNALTPACVGWNQVELRGLTFNRSYVPFRANDARGAQDQRLLHETNQAERQSAQLQQAAARPEPRPVEASGQKRDEDDGELSGPETAVDPRLSVLRFDRRQPGSEQCTSEGPPLGVLAIFGMHPTGIANTNELYHGDIFGFATRTAQACLSRTVRKARRAEGSSALGWAEDKDEREAEAKPPNGCDDSILIGDSSVVVGLANGVEGDVSPNLNFQSVPGARRLGRKLGLQIAEVTANIQTLSPRGRLSRAYWELSFPNGQYGSRDGDRLCRYAELGMATAGGAHDGPTRLRVITEANAGFRLEPEQGCHGAKLPLQVFLGHDEYDFPTLGPIGLLRVGPAVLATIPAEVTTIVGTRIREVLGRRLGSPPIAIVGLTNQYFQYVTTEQEYPYQFYEGASNLYGPHSADFLIRHFDCLADWLLNPHASLACKGQAPINRLTRFEAHPAPEVRRMPEEEHVSPLILKNPDVYVTWFDGDQGWQMTFARLPLDFTADRDKFRVHVLRGASGETVVDDDLGSAIEVREVNNGDNWQVRWTPFVTSADGGRDRCGKTFRLAVRGRFQFESVPFKLVCQSVGQMSAR